MQLDKETKLKQEKERCRQLAQRVAEEAHPASAQVLNSESDLLEKALRHAASQAEPDWSEKEGHWAKAAQTGVMNGEGPERPVKRDELAAVLGRLGLL